MDGRVLRLRILIPLFSFLLVLEQLPGGVHFTLVAPYVATLVVVFLVLVMRFAWSLLLILREPKGSPTALRGRRLLSSSGRALVAVLGVVFIAWILPDRAWVKFDRHAWHARDSTTVTWPSAYSVRERMVDDLVTHVLPGLTVQERQDDPRSLRGRQSGTNPVLPAVSAPDHRQCPSRADLRQSGPLRQPRLRQRLSGRGTRERWSNRETVEVKGPRGSQARLTAPRAVAGSCTRSESRQAHVIVALNGGIVGQTPHAPP